MDENTVARFWSKVDKNGTAPANRPELGPCWVWRGSKRRGYGVYWDGDDPESAHRMSYVMANGTIPGGLLICHHCDLPACVNPRHLYAGTPKDNANDMGKRGRRGNRGERAGGAKLTEELVREIRSSAEPARTMAKRLGVRASTIRKIRRRERWMHVD